MNARDLKCSVLVIALVAVLIFAGYSFAQYANMLGEQHGGESEMISCTAEAKMCPDGSAVGRTGPDCTFAPCPSGEDVGQEHAVIVCTDDEKQRIICTQEYRPVCGLIEVQCVTTPCDPVPQTFGNGCSACAQGNVISYTEGACARE